MRFTKTHERQLREFMTIMDGGGCVPVTEWTTGKGRYTSRRALPPFVRRFARVEYPETARPSHGTPERFAYGFFLKNPRKKAVLVLDREALAAFLFDNAHGNEF